MDARIEILKKNYDERMNEFVNVLSKNDCLPGCKVLDEWRFHLELTLKCSGWVAVYKPSKDRQPGPGLDFINEVVMVEKVVFHTFEALVFGLEPVECTSSVSESSSMTSKTFCLALEDLLYDIEHGQVSCEVAERVRRLFGQAWRAHEALRHLEVAMDEAGDTASLESQESQTQEEEEGLVIRMMQLHHRIDNIQKELERLQNPLIRNLMIREKQRALKRTRTKDQPWVRLVWSGGDADELTSCLTEATTLAQDKTRLKIYPLVQMALEEAVTGDMVLLAPGNYALLGSGGLEEGGTIKGLGSEKVFMSGCESGDVMLSLHCKSVGGADEDEMDCDAVTPDFLLSNVSLNAHNIEICLLLNSGLIILENCKIDGGGSHTADSIGIMVREGTKLVARDCTISGFCTGLVAYEGSQLELENCSIQSCEIGMKMSRGVKARVEKCVVSECSTSGVMYQWQGHEDDLENTVVTQDVLNST
ncbi:hypothetical protein B566_EDAN016557 [Ephemera danica]|nr:hypothetical protein B566_EDAN016557 [Ephemera danica]